MKYRVELARAAKEEIDEAYAWLLERTEAHADPWYDGLMEAIDSLSNEPRRCAPVPENDMPDVDLRQLWYGRRDGRYRILFAVRAKPC